MKKFWQVFGNWSKYQKEVLQTYNVNVEEGCNNIVLDNASYSSLRLFFEEWNLLVSPCVVFSKQEILSANYCVINNWKTVGFPMPDNDNGYLNATYDVRQMCRLCGEGKIQINDFFIKRIPKEHFWGLGWVYDEFFADVEIYTKVFKPFGVDCRPVRLYKTGAVVSSFVQLVIPEASEHLNLQSYDYETCPVCGVIKYSPKIASFFPSHKNTNLNMYKSFEYFGDGHSAFKKIFVSRELREKMIEYGIMRVNAFVPCV